jgi:CRISPR-associated protein Cmr4
MYRKTQMLFFHCQTPTHVGSGAEVGIVDLPIQREGHTQYPKFEASSLKGALRQAVENKVLPQEDSIGDDAIKVHRIFGLDEHSKAGKQAKKLLKIEDKDPEFAGCIGFSDARLLLFPIKSMRGVFAWATSFQALNRFKQDLNLAKCQRFDQVLNSLCTKPLSSQAVLVGNQSKVLIGNKVALEEYAFSAEKSSEVDELAQLLIQLVFPQADDYFKQKIKSNLVVLHDDDFKDFVELSTEVITRNRIDNQTGTVAKGALFSEEYLPAESILYSINFIAQEFRSKDPLSVEDVASFMKTHLSELIFQIGGNATLGKGIVKTSLFRPEE